MTLAPFVSVIIPTYNRSKVICRAIDSALAQTYRHREIIVVDDGSTDDTQSTLRQYGDRICVLTQENAGPSVARNRGIALARGEIVACLDSDDYWMPTKLARQVEALEEAGSSASCCLCDCTVIYNDGTKSSTFNIAGIVPSCPSGIWVNPAEVLSTRFVVFTQAVAIRREALQRVGAFDESLPFFCEDYDLALRLALEGCWAIIKDELVVCQDASPDSLGQKALQDIVRLRNDQLQVKNRFLSLVTSDPRHARLEKHARRELRRAERELLEARLRKLDYLGATCAAWLLRLTARVGRAIFRRSPGYPRVIVRSLG